MYRFGNHVPRAHVKREIRELIRSFPNKVTMVIRRQKEKFSDLGTAKDDYDIVYRGEGLVRPGSGTTQGYGLGTVENLSLVGLINGVLDIRQSDIVTINDGREYEVSFPPTWFDAFTTLQLTQRSQIGQPRTL